MCRSPMCRSGLAPAPASVPKAAQAAVQAAVEAARQPGLARPGMLARPLALVLALSLALSFAPLFTSAAAPPATPWGDPEPPNAQARAVAALAHARVIALAPAPPLALVLAPPKTIGGIGGSTGGQPTTLAGGAKDLASAMTDLHAKVVGQEIHIELAADVLFDFDKADIRPEAAATLAKAAVIVRAHPGGHVRVEGHTDNKGTHAYNLALSQRRAQAVVTWLRERQGLRGASFQVHGFAETRPVAPNALPGGADNPAGRQQNRRVEIVVSP
jgi:outer membrane protein OmpA-like peptidoglycan-associated protein